MSPTLRVYSLPAEPQGKSKNSGVGSLSLLQQIFPTQVLTFPTQTLNQGLLRCRLILYQLSYQARKRWIKISAALPGEGEGEEGLLVGTSAGTDACRRPHLPASGWGQGSWNSKHKGFPSSITYQMPTELTCAQHVR